MTRWAWVIDQTRCIGCHACTTACKSENDVPVGVFRTWVKNVEVGTFPEVRRHFAVLRCNHCEDAPCVEVCPVTAMYQRPDGLVDFDHDACIGCKACMQACPYDAIYMDPDSNTAAKCNFCSHRVDEGLLPACVVVCPEEALLFGDMEDPTSKVSRALEAARRQRAAAGAGHEAARVLHRRARRDRSSRWPRDTTLPICGRIAARATRATVHRSRSTGERRSAGARRATTSPGSAHGVGRSSSYIWTKGIAAGSASRGIGQFADLGVGLATCWRVGAPALALVFLGAHRRVCWSAISSARSASGPFSRGRSGELARARRGRSSRSTARCSSPGWRSRCFGSTAVRCSARTGPDRRRVRSRAGYTAPLLRAVRGARPVAEPAAAAAAARACARSAASRVADRRRCRLGERLGAVAVAGAAFVVAALVAGLLALRRRASSDTTRRTPAPPRTRSRAAHRRGSSGCRSWSASRSRCRSRSPERRRLLAAVVLGRSPVSGCTGTRSFSRDRARRSHERDLMTSERRLHSLRPGPHAGGILRVPAASSGGTTGSSARRRYSLVPTTCFNCEAACGLVAYVDKRRTRSASSRAIRTIPGVRGRNCAKGPATLNQIKDPGAHPLSAEARRRARRGQVGARRRGTKRSTMLAGADPRARSQARGRTRSCTTSAGPGNDGYMERVLAGVGRRWAQQPHEHLLVGARARLRDLDGRSIGRAPITRTRSSSC